METTLPATPVPEIAPLARRRRRLPDALHRLLRSPGPMLGLIIVAAFIFISLTAQWIAPHDYDQANFSMARKSPSAEHWLGNDELGRDLFSRLLHGARLSLIIGIISVSIGLLIGLPIGLISGYAGGKTDLVTMRFMDILLAFPSILLAILLVATFGPGLNNAMIAIGIVSIPIYARLVRSSTLAAKNELFIEASRSTGASGLRILLRHIFPNTTAPVVVQSTLQIAAAILAAAALGFLGLGAPPDVPEWGNMLQKGRTYIVSAPHIVIFPGLAIMITVLGFNLLGDGLRDALDPRMKR
jgi:peptide/nickel transport system permease protein